MSMTEFKINLPDELIEEFNLENKKTVFVKKGTHRVLLKNKNTGFDFQSVSLRWFLLPVIISSLIFFILFNYQQESQIPMTGGDFSIASAVTILGLISGTISFVIFFIKEKRKDENSSLADIHWRNVPTIIFSYIITLGLTIMSFFWIIGVIFKDASFDIYTATIIFIIFCAIINYFMIYAALSFTSNMIVRLLISVIIGGVLFAMITNSSSHWWQYNFSFLGTNKAINSWQFNLTLILSAFLVAALVDYLFVNLKKNNYDGPKIILLRILLTLVAVALGGVGFFPNNGKGHIHELHNNAASLLVFLIVILIIGIKWLLPKVTKEFLVFSYSIAITLVIADILFQHIGYLSLTAFELIAFVLAFSWILLLLQHIQKLTNPTDSVYEIDIELIEKKEN